MDRFLGLSMANLGDNIHYTYSINEKKGILYTFFGQDLYTHFHASWWNVFSKLFVFSLKLKIIEN